MQALEAAKGLDVLEAPLRRLAPSDEGSLRSALLGTRVGHALHPFLTDLPVGFWTSSLVLDLLGGEGARQNSRRLVAAGLVAAVPTAATGLAEWTTTSRAQRRVASAHAGLNVVALVLYAASWVVRPRSHRVGASLSSAGAAVVGLSGFLGGHLTVARKVGSRHPGFIDVDSSATPGPDATPR